MCVYVDECVRAWTFERELVIVMFTQILRCYSALGGAGSGLTQNAPEGEPCVAAQGPPV